MSLCITGRVSNEHMQPQSLLAHRPQGPRTRLPAKAWDGQDFAPMQKGLDRYSATPEQDFATLADLKLNLYTLENAWFVIANGLDGVILTEAGHLVEEPSCFADPTMTAPHQDLMALGLPVVEMNDVFVGSDGAWNNYFHWLCYGLARSRIAARVVPDTCQIVVPEYGPRPGGFQVAYTPTTYEQTLQASGLADRLTRLPIGLYHAKTLRFMWSLPRQPTEFLELPEFYEMFASIRATLKHRPDAPRRLLVSRAGARDPRIGAEAAKLVQDMCLARGFALVRFEDMDFNAQAEALYNADCIVAPHGAGLVNTLFGRDTLRVLELNSEMDGDGSTRACFYQITTNRGQPYMTLNGSKGEIDAGRMAAALDFLCAG